MAIALKPSSTIYSARREDEASNTSNNSRTNEIKMTDSYADSPSRRRSSRIASMSPNSFNHTINRSDLNNIDNNNFGFFQHQTMNSTSTTTSGSSSSYMPASPSRRHSIRLQGGVSIDEITMNSSQDSLSLPFNDINTNANNSGYFKNGTGGTVLQSRPDRVHPQLHVIPTNLNTPSATLTTENSTGKSSGITPSINQINIKNSNIPTTTANTPSNKLLDKLVSKLDFEEIAKATPLGSFYNRNQPPVAESKKAAEADRDLSNSNKEKVYNFDPQNIKYSQNNSSRNIQMPVQQHQQSTQQQRTPQKQVSDLDRYTRNIAAADQPTHVVRTLRNRSIVASPSRRDSFSSLNHPHPRTVVNNNNNNSPKSITIFDNFFIQISIFYDSICTFLKINMKNVFVVLFVLMTISASVYHIYEAFQNEEKESEVKEVDDNSNKTVGDVPVILKPEYLDSNDSYISSSSPPHVPETLLSSANTVDLHELIKDFVTKEEVKELISEFGNEINGNISKVHTEIDEKIIKIVSEGKEETDLKLQKQNRRYTQKQNQIFEKVTESVKGIERKILKLEEKIKSIELERGSVSGSVRVSVSDSQKANLNTSDRTDTKEHKHHDNLLIDYASDESGGKINYKLTSSPLILKGSQKGGKGKDANTVIALKNPVVPGSCFSFSGDRGKIAITLREAMIPNRFTIQHPLLPDHRSAAPRDFELWALNSPDGELDGGRPILLVKGSFDRFGPETQSFPILSTSASVKPVKYIQMRIRNNHGNQKFTCVYRVHVYGNGK